MKNLHEIAPAGVHLWMQVFGISGRWLPISRTAHAYRSERQTPPPLHPDTEWGPRRHWSPYSLAFNGPATLEPICGRLRTSSRRPQASIASMWADRCPTCQGLAPNAMTQNQLFETDPWYAIQNRERHFTVDPVTGI